MSRARRLTHRTLVRERVALARMQREAQRIDGTLGRVFMGPVFVGWAIANPRRPDKPKPEPARIEFEMHLPEFDADSVRAAFGEVVR